MASIFQTMFVSPSSSPFLPHGPKTLPPISTLAESTSRAKDGDLERQSSPMQKEVVASNSSWLGLFNASQLQAIFGSKMGRANDVERQTGEQTHSSAAPRASIESLRQSLGTPRSPASGVSPRMPSPAQIHDRPGAEVDDVMFCSNSRARGPFKPQKTNRGTSSWQLRQFAEATLGSGSLRKAVKLPEGEDINEWLAVNVVDFYNQINLLYGSITEFCSPQTCPEMKATDEFEYLWQDSENFKRPTKMPAPEYIEHLMAWSQSNIDNEQLFPSRIGVPFPKTFPSLVRQMFKRLYRVYAHIYCHHYPVIIQLGLEPHLNTSFKHYTLFIDEHQLATGKDFWGPLGDLVESMLRSD